MSLFHAMLGAGGPLTFDQIVLRDAAFFFDTSYLTTMYKEGSGNGGNPTTPVTANGDTVGFFYDRSKNALFARAPATNNTFWPVLGSDGTRNGYVTFDGSNDRLIVQSNYHLNKFHSANPSFSLYFWIKFNGGNATTQILFTNNNAGTGNGFTLFKNTSNKLSWATYVAGVNKSSKLSTNSITTSSGWLPVIISMDGAGAGKGRMIIGELEDSTFDVSAGSDTAVATESTYLGSRSSFVNFLNASIGDMIILPYPTTTDLIASFKAYNPPRNTSTEFPSILMQEYDFGDTSRMYSDVAETTNVTNGSVVRSVIGENGLQNFGNLNRKLTSVSDAKSPIYNTNQINGYGAISFDGVDDDLDILSGLCGEIGGKYLLIVVCKNLKAATGSHILSSGTNTSGRYIALTGTGWNGQFPFTPYFALHAVGGDSVAPNPVGTVDDQWRLLAVRRKGTALKAWNSNLETSSVTTTGGVFFIHMGQEEDLFPDWKLQGSVAYLKKWNGSFSDAEVEAKIAELKTKYNIS